LAKFIWDIFLCCTYIYIKVFLSRYLTLENTTFYGNQVQRYIGMYMCDHQWLLSWKVSFANLKIPSLQLAKAMLTLQVFKTEFLLSVVGIDKNTILNTSQGYFYIVFSSLCRWLLYDTFSCSDIIKLVQGLPLDLFAWSANPSSLGASFNPTIISQDVFLTLKKIQKNPASNCVNIP
jgi:hypothetical protein